MPYAALMASGPHSRRGPAAGQAPLPVLRGRRVVLRPVEEADRTRLLQILAEPEVERWWRRAEWDRVLEPESHTFVIEMDADGDSALLRTIGLIQFTEELDEDYRCAGIDLFLSGEVHGRGLGPEAIRVLVRYLIDGRDHHRFIIDPAAENERAIRSYRKVGFRPVGVMRRYERVSPGVYRDGLLMDLLAEELTE